MIDVGKAIWYKIIEEALGQGYSAYRTLQMARNIGLKIRTATFYSMWNEVKAQKSLPELLSKYDPEKPLAWYMHPKTQYNYPSRYGYVVEITEAETGAKFNFGIYTNRTKSIKEIEEEAYEVCLKHYEVIPERIEITHMWRK